MGESKDICSKISSLDLGNPSDVVWAYKNIAHICRSSSADFLRVAEMLMNHKPLDFNASSSVLEEIGNTIHECFDSTEDEELRFVMDRCGVETGVHTHAPLWCVDHLYRLVLPFSRICTKQVVDIVAFLFTRTAAAEFDDLFEIFGAKKDFLVELNLLKVRLMRERRERYRCRRCSASLEDCIRSIKITEVDEKGTDFYSLVDGDVSHPADDVDHSQNRPFSDSSEKTRCLCMPGGECLCASYDSADEEHCLEEAKRHLLELEKISPRFFLENTALYLSLAADQDLLALFRKYMSTEHRAICTANVFRLVVDAETVEEMVLVLGTDVLRADGLVVGRTTLQLYVDWCVATFSSISVSSICDYAEISRLYIRFLQTFRHRRMFGILSGICACKIEKVTSIVSGHLVASLEEIVDIFLDMEDASEMDDVFRHVDADPAPTTKELEQIVMAVQKHHRKAFLSQIGVLRRFGDNLRSRVVAGLCGNYDTDWRYRRELLHAYEQYPDLFKDIDMPDALASDPVFVVRQTALDMKERHT